MQAPAVGRGLSELLLHGGYQTLDLSRLGYRRILDSSPLHDRRAEGVVSDTPAKPAEHEVETATGARSFATGPASTRRS